MNRSPRMSPISVPMGALDTFEEKILKHLNGVALREAVARPDSLSANSKAPPINPPMTTPPAPVRREIVQITTATLPQFELFDGSGEALVMTALCNDGTAWVNVCYPSREGIRGSSWYAVPPVPQANLDPNTPDNEPF
jgi:hypothetical protein